MKQSDVLASGNTSRVVLAFIWSGQRLDEDDLVDQTGLSRGRVRTVLDDLGAQHLQEFEPDDKSRFVYKANIS